MTTLDDASPDPSAVSPAALFRAFARRPHPDVGGAPETFRRGLEAFRAGRSPFEAVPDVGPGPRSAVAAPRPRRPIPAAAPRRAVPIIAVSGHVVPRTLRAGRRWLGRGPLQPVRTRRVV